MCPPVGGASLAFFEGETLPGVKAFLVEEQREDFIAGNWKLNKDINKAERFAGELKQKLVDQNAVDIAVCPVFLHFWRMQKLQHTNINVADKIHPSTSGAFTGEISAEIPSGGGFPCDCWTF